MERLRYFLTALALFCVGTLFGGSLYDTLVLAPNLHGGPEGLEHGRLLWQNANYLRVVLVITAWLCTLRALARTAQRSRLDA